MKLNIENTCALVVRKENLDSILLIDSNSDTSVVKHTKFLGIYLDNNLNGKIHIEKLSRKLSKLCYALCKLWISISLTALLQVYYALVHSNIRYGILFWGNSTSVDTILKIQKRCVRILTNSGPIEHARPLFKQLKILTVIDVYILECANFVKRNPGLFLE